MKVSINDSIEEKMKAAWKSFYDIPAINENKLVDIEAFPFLKQIENNDVVIFHLNLYGGSLNYVSENVESVLGAKRAELMKDGITQLLKQLIPQHISYSSVVTEMFREVFNSWSSSELLNLKLTIVGLHMIHPEKGEITIINNGTPIEWDKNNLATKNINLMQDISHLSKNKDYWIRIWSTVNSGKVNFFHCNSEHNIKKDILSPREKEILELIIAGKNTDEIAKKLYLSRLTINNHRQNILDRFGVKDTTALTILAGLVGFVKWGNNKTLDFPR
jgi:DNA-binding CsgD family transcriptional regulator